MKGTLNVFLARGLGPIFALFLFSTPALALDCDTLPTPLKVRVFQCIHGVLVSHNPDVTWEDLDADAVALFVHGYNISPPPSAVTATDVRIYAKPRSKKNFVVIALGPRVVDALEAPKEVVNTWRAGKAWEDPHNSL